MEGGFMKSVHMGMLTDVMPTADTTSTFASFAGPATPGVNMHPAATWSHGATSAAKNRGLAFILSAAAITGGVGYSIYQVHRLLKARDENNTRPDRVVVGNGTSPDTPPTEGPSAAAAAASPGRPAGEQRRRDPKPRRSDSRHQREAAAMARSLPRGWRYHEYLGGGSYGEVCLAISDRTGQMCALKSMPRTSADELRREFSVMQRLRHPNVVEVYEFVETDTQCWIAMEWVPGGTLGQLFVRHPVYGNESLLKNYALQIFRGLRALHEAGIIHRDIKPENILIDQMGRLKLSDFGLARQRDPTTGLTTTMRVAGSPAYIAPEIAKVYTTRQARYECTVWGDIWAAGATLVHAATGQTPWHHVPVSDATQLLAHLAENCGKPGHHPLLPDGLSDDAIDFLKLCFAPQPEARTTCDALLGHRWLVGASPGTASQRSPAIASPLAADPSGATASPM